MTDAPDIEGIKARLAAVPKLTHQQIDSLMLKVSEAAAEEAQQLHEKTFTPGPAIKALEFSCIEYLTRCLATIEQLQAEIERLKTACPCHERAMQMLGDQRVGVMVQNLSQWTPVQPVTCLYCDRNLSPRFRGNPGNPPVWACDTCNPLLDPPPVQEGE